MFKLMEKTRLALKFSQEIRTETRIEGDMFRIINLKGDVFRIIHHKIKFGGDIWGGFIPYYIPEGGYVNLIRQK